MDEKNRKYLINSDALQIGIVTGVAGMKKWREDLPKRDEHEALNESERHELVRLRAECKEQEKWPTQQDMEIRFAKKSWPG